MADDAFSLNGGEDEDEALRIAIAMSLGQDPNSGKESKVAIDLTGDDPVRFDTPATKVTGKENKTTPPPVTSGLAALGLDRRKMEEERLARIKKRKATDLEDAHESISHQRQKMAPGFTLPKTEAPGTDSSSAVGLPFQKGVVKKTWAFRQPRTGDDIKIEEVLQKNDLELAVISSFQWDEDWMMSKLDMKKTKLVLVAFAANDREKADMQANVPKDKIRFCFPPMHGVGAMHSKLQLLKYDSFLRIVVPSGNMVPYDWGETGAMENMVFLIDLPRIEDAEKRASNKLTAFGESLSYFLVAQGLDNKLIESLSNYDFAETTSYAFVHTIAGSHQTENTWSRTGYCGLGNAVKTLGLSSQSPIQVDFVCSSIGSVNESFVTALYNACQGDSGLKEYNHRLAKSKAKQLAGQQERDWRNIQDRFRVYFPSHTTVAQSKGGVNGAGTICFQPKWWAAATFPHQILRDCKSTRPGLLMHSKILFVRPDGPGEARAFVYVGSANFSESAWGKLSSGQDKKPKLYCRNWECGVLVQAEQERCDATDLQGAFEGHVPVPMRVPGTSYPSPSSVAEASLAPWFFRG